MKTVVYSINGKYFLDFGINISESKGLLDKLKPKPRKSYSWAEQHGTVVDLSKPRYEEREISLKGWIIGENWHDMKAKFDLFLSEFDKARLARLLIEFGKELVYDVYLADGIELEKEFRDGKMHGLFTLKLKEPNPVKKVLKLVGNDLQLSFTSPDWIDINIDGVNEIRKDSISINKTLQNRAVGGLDLGGRNLVLNSKDARGGVFPVYTSEPLIEGQEYALSFDVKGDINGDVFLNKSIVKKIQKLNNPNDWSRIGFTFTFIKNDYIGRELYPHIYGATFVKNIKLEKGNKATDWTPAPEDVEAQFQNLQNGITNIQTSLGDVKTKTDNFTSIQGGLVSSNIISVGDTQVSQNAFISGVTDAGGMSVRFGAGANYTNKNNAPFRVLDNGKMIAENAEINGKINAHSGKIGGFEINEGFTAYSYSPDSWAYRNEYVSITPTSFLMRKNGHQRGEHQREVRMGITTSAASGWDGAVAMIENTLPPEFGFGTVDNIALMLKAQNSGANNIALDILDGDIRVKGKQGATTGEILVSKREIGNKFIYTYMNFVNGILTGLRNETKYL